jgi:hypothetical protein
MNIVGKLKRNVHGKGMHKTGFPSFKVLGEISDGRFDGRTINRCYQMSGMITSSMEYLDLWIFIYSILIFLGT